MHEQSIIDHKRNLVSKRPTAFVRVQSVAFSLIKGNADLMRWCIFGTDFFVCDCEKLKMYWMYIEFFGKKQAGKDVSKMCRRINQWFLKYAIT